MNIGGVKGYVYSEVIASGNGTAVIVAPIQNASGLVSCTIVSSGNSGKVQYSTSTVAKVEAGTATWFDWDTGVVTATTCKPTTGPITAARGVSTSGAVTFELVV